MSESIGEVFDGASLYGLSDDDLFMQLTLPHDAVEDIGSVAFLINGAVVAVDNYAPFRSYGDASGEDRRSLVLRHGGNSLQARFYEQSNLGGSFLDEWVINFTVY